MTSFTTAYLDVTYDETQQLLFGRWKRGVMPFELQQGYSAILDIAAATNCRFWLLDIRRRTGVDASDVFWITEEFFPRLQPRMGHTTYMAFLMSPHHLAGVLAGNGADIDSAPDGLPYAFQRFTEESAALAWLEHCHQHDSVER